MLSISDTDLKLLILNQLIKLAEKHSDFKGLFSKALNQQSVMSKPVFDHFNHFNHFNSFSDLLSDDDSDNNDDDGDAPKTAFDLIKIQYPELCRIIIDSKLNLAADNESDEEDIKRTPSSMGFFTKYQSLSSSSSQPELGNTIFSYAHTPT